MKHRVVFNTRTRYLHVTTAEISEMQDSSDLVELFSCSTDINGEPAPSMAMSNCNIFCLGYIRGNNELKANNSIKDFGF